MQKLKTKLEATKAKLEAQDYTGLTKDDILGDLLYTTALAYFAEMDAMDHVTAKTMGIENVRLPSEAIFSYELDTTFILGSPMYVSSGGLAMDIDRDVTASVPLDGDMDKLVQFVLTSGMNGSALEHSVPEQMFSTPENPAEGISAVKALRIANDQGIPIYTVNRTNIDTVLPQLEVSQRIKTNIVNAVNAGMVVTVPKTNITYNGWTGVGYIIINPDTGAGAYMIGGLSGGVVFAAWVAGLLVLIILASFGLAALTALIAIGIVNLMAIVIATLPLILLHLSSRVLFWSPIVLWAAYECAINMLPAGPPDLVTALCLLILVLGAGKK